MNKHFHTRILQATGATDLFKVETIQSLWSGYGEIMRYGLQGSELNNVIVKHVRLPDKSHHPRGWNTDLSHQRKIKSYQVEMAWYTQWSGFCSSDCRVPRCLATESRQNEMLILMEDLDNAGYPVRKAKVSDQEVKACLSWLAHFHAGFMGKAPENLWSVGTYWHLDTRPDELNALQDTDLKQAAPLIDKRLNTCKYQTLLHGDAKLANFCFSKNESQVAAVDFQYAGGGCGMKDVAYFIGSCLNEQQCQQQETLLLDFYFQKLTNALSRQQIDINVHAVEQEWRLLYPVAWTDFHRFLKGWSPNHWKINSYSERLARDVITQLNQTSRK